MPGLLGCSRTVCAVERPASAIRQRSSGHLALVSPQPSTCFVHPRREVRLDQLRTWAFSRQTTHQRTKSGALPAPTFQVADGKRHNGGAQSTQPCVRRERQRLTARGPAKGSGGEMTTVAVHRPVLELDSLYLNLLRQAWYEDLDRISIVSCPRCDGSTSWRGTADPVALALPTSPGGHPGPQQCAAG